MRKSFIKHPEPQRPVAILREADIRAMIADGSIADQHFLIRILAEKFTPSN